MNDLPDVVVLSATRTAIGRYGGGLTNPNGSGISLGHPLAATGAILVVKALYELRRTGGRYAVVTMCIGGGQGIAAIFERA